MDDDTLGSEAAERLHDPQLSGDDERDGRSGAVALRGHDSVEAEAIRAEGLDPDDPAGERWST